jgi:SAM-dependent methyltransferase
MSDDHNPPEGISTRLVSFSAEAADPLGANNYDSFAEGYAASNENNLFNAYYERPAMLALAGDVAGRRVLDAGCGSGPLLAALRDRGAIVTGIDKSAGMLELARRRLGDDADLQVAELGCPFPFPDGTFEDVTASLVLHYLEDWGPALAELRRVLKPGGRLIVSVNHPFAENLWHREAGQEPDYFATYNYTVEWTMGGQSALLRFWTRPLHAMTDAFTAAGFRISVISEPAVAPDTPANCCRTTSPATGASCASCSLSSRVTNRCGDRTLLRRAIRVANALAEHAVHSEPPIWAAWPSRSWSVPHRIERSADGREGDQARAAGGAAAREKAK